MESGFQVDGSLIDCDNQREREAKKKVCFFSEFGLYALVHRHFQKSVSEKSFVSSPTSIVKLFLFCGG